MLLKLNLEYHGSNTNSIPVNDVRETNESREAKESVGKAPAYYPNATGSCSLMTQVTLRVKRFAPKSQ